MVSPKTFWCHLVCIISFNYITDKQLKQTIDRLVGETLIAAAAEDVTDGVLHEALLKAQGGSYTNRFIMSSKKPPVTNSEDETAVDSEAPTAPQGDTPLTPEVMKMVNSLSTVDEENTFTCSEKDSLEEEIKKMISRISAFEFELSPGKNVTEGRGDAQGVETAPTGGEESCESQAAPDLLLDKDEQGVETAPTGGEGICESQAAPDLLLDKDAQGVETAPTCGEEICESQAAPDLLLDKDAQGVETAPTCGEEICESQAAPDLLLDKDSSKERIFQENKDDIAAWEEAVEVEVQIIDPSYDENTPIYYTETTSPYTSSMESISDSEPMEHNTCSEFPATDGDVGSYELKHPTYEDSFSNKTTSDELELEALAICTSMVVEIMSRVEETIIENEANIHHKEEIVAHTLNISHIKENDKHGEKNEEISASKQILMKVDETQVIAPVTNLIKSSTEPIYGQISTEESEEEDLYDIESINVHSEDILEQNHKSVLLSEDSLQNQETDHLETYEKAMKTSADEHNNNTTEMTAPLLSFQSSIGETMALSATAAHQELCLSETKSDKALCVKEKEECNFTIFKDIEDTKMNPSSLSTNNKYLKTEHLESFTATTNIHFKMGNKVQSCDDIFIRAKEPQSGSTDLLENTSERTEITPTASARSLDSLAEACFTNKELEEIKYQSEQRENSTPSMNMERKVSPILTHKDEKENVPVIQNEGTEDRQATSTSIALKCIDEVLETLDVQAPKTDQSKTENHSKALVLAKKKEIEISDASAFGDNNITDLFASITTIIKDGLETTEIAKTEEGVLTRTKSSQDLKHTTVHSVQENKEEEMPANYLETTYILSSQENKSVGYCPHESSDITILQHVSKHKTRTDDKQIPSSTRDERGSRKKHDVEYNMGSRKKLTPGEAANGKVYKTWKFGNKMKKLISSLKRKNQNSK